MTGDPLSDGRSAAREHVRAVMNDSVLRAMERFERDLVDASRTPRCVLCGAALWVGEAHDDDCAALALEAAFNRDDYDFNSDEAAAKNKWWNE